MKVAVAHGQMAAGALDDIMTAFYDGQYDVLLSTSIVESGLDIPTANTLIVHRADMFGLAQLYQLRGRVGRAKQRAYALFTVPAGRTLTGTAERRLKVLQQLDTLGAGFQLASHDLDIRGAGNLLGEEQSGHIREVGYELYQQMLEEAVASLKGGGEAEVEGRWSPQITVGMAVMIPESYVADLQLRLGLYKRLADLDQPAEIDAFAAELIDRFGPLPREVEHLLEIVTIKALCRRANVEKADVGPKGAVIAFRGNVFANPAGLIKWIGEQGSLARVRPDQTVVLIRDWADAERPPQGHGGGDGGARPPRRGGRTGGRLKALVNHPIGKKSTRARIVVSLPNACAIAHYLCIGSDCFCGEHCRCAEVSGPVPARLRGHARPVGRPPGRQPDPGGSASSTSSRAMFTASASAASRSAR